VYDEDKGGKREFLGAVAIPLLAASISTRARYCHLGPIEMEAFYFIQLCGTVNLSSSATPLLQIKNDRRDVWPLKNKHLTMRHRGEIVLTFRLTYKLVGSPGQSPRSCRV
jgi:hypothetical protein